MIRAPSDLIRATFMLIALPSTLTPYPLTLIVPTQTVITAPSDLIRATVSLIAVRRTLTPPTRLLIAMPRKLIASLS